MVSLVRLLARITPYCALIVAPGAIQLAQLSGRPEDRFGRNSSLMRSSTCLLTDLLSDHCTVLHKTEQHLVTTLVHERARPSWPAFAPSPSCLLSTPASPDSSCVVASGVTSGHNGHPRTSHTHNYPPAKMSRSSSSYTSQPRLDERSKSVAHEGCLRVVSWDSARSNSLLARIVYLTTGLA